MTKRDEKLGDEYRITETDGLYSVDCIIAGEREVLYPVLTRAEAWKWLVQYAPLAVRIRDFTLPKDLWMGAHE